MNRTNKKHIVLLFNSVLGIVALRNRKKKTNVTSCLHNLITIFTRLEPLLNDVHSKRLRNQTGASNKNVSHNIEQRVK